VLVRPTVIDYLTTGVIYLKVAASVFERPFVSFCDLLHYLSKNGIYVVDQEDEPINDKDLAEKYPFKMVSTCYFLKFCLCCPENFLCLN